MARKDVQLDKQLIPLSNCTIFSQASRRIAKLFAECRDEVIDVGVTEPLGDQLHRHRRRHEHRMCLLQAMGCHKGKYGLTELSAELGIQPLRR